MIEVQPATTRDYAAFGALMPELGVDDAVPELERFAVEIAPHTLVAHEDDRVLGYTFAHLLGDRVHVRHLVVAPAARGRGVGRLLMEGVCAACASRGARTVSLNVKPDNVPALRLYEALGMRPHHTSCALRFPWTLLDTLPAPPVGLGARALDPVEDALVERAFDLAAGQLASLRALPGRVLVAAFAHQEHASRSEPSEPLGLAVFDPGFPASSPFRVSAPVVARALLAALRPHARHAEMRLVAEADPALADLLCAHGATRVLDMVNYRGALPLARRG